MLEDTVRRIDPFGPDTSVYFLRHLAASDFAFHLDEKAEDCLPPSENWDWLQRRVDRCFRELGYTAVWEVYGDPCALLYIVIGHHSGLNADWCVRAWSIGSCPDGRTIWILDQEDRDSRDSLVVCLRDPGAEEGGITDVGVDLNAKAALELAEKLRTQPQPTRTTCMNLYDLSKMIGREVRITCALTLTETQIQGETEKPWVAELPHAYIVHNNGRAVADGSGISPQAALKALANNIQGKALEYLEMPGNSGVQGQLMVPALETPYRDIFYGRPEVEDRG